jgi:hypothetical protein
LVVPSLRFPRQSATTSLQIDNSKRFHYGLSMAEYTLKNIPEELYHRAQSAAEGSLRSLNQEIIFRLRK